MVEINILPGSGTHDRTPGFGLLRRQLEERQYHWTVVSKPSWFGILHVGVYHKVEYHQGSDTSI
jgi:hypothetical protein